MTTVTVQVLRRLWWKSWEGTPKKESLVFLVKKSTAIHYKWANPAFIHCYRRMKFLISDPVHQNCWLWTRVLLFLGAGTALKSPSLSILHSCCQLLAQDSSFNLISLWLIGSKAVQWLWNTLPVELHQLHVTFRQLLETRLNVTWAQSDSFNHTI